MSLEFRLLVGKSLTPAWATFKKAVSQLESRQLT